MPLCHWKGSNHYELMMQSTFIGVMLYALRDQTALGDSACMQIVAVNYKRGLIEVSLTSH